jgi:transposase
MARVLLTDELGEFIKPLLPAPKERRFRFPGRKPIDTRVCLSGILFVLKAGIPWEDLPPEMGCSGMTCWNRLRDWQVAGVWDQIHRVMLKLLNGTDLIDRERAILDSSYIRALAGGATLAPTPRTEPNWAASTT